MILLKVETVLHLSRLLCNVLPEMSSMNEHEN